MSWLCVWHCWAARWDDALFRINSVRDCGLHFEISIRFNRPGSVLTVLEVAVLVVAAVLVAAVVVVVVLVVVVLILVVLILVVLIFIVLIVLVVPVVAVITTRALTFLVVIGVLVITIVAATRNIVAMRCLMGGLCRGQWWDTIS